MLGDRINDRKRISLAFLGTAHTMDLLSWNTGRQPHRLFLFALTNETNHPVSPHRACMYVSMNRVNGRQSSLSGCYDPPCTLKKRQSGALFKEKGHNPLRKIKTLWWMCHTVSLNPASGVWESERGESEEEGWGISVVLLSCMPSLTPDTHPPWMSCFCNPPTLPFLCRANRPMEKPECIN